MSWARTGLAVALGIFLHAGVGQALTVDFDDIPTTGGGAPVAVDGDRYLGDGVYLSSGSGDLYVFNPTNFDTNTPQNYLFSSTAPCEPGSCNALGDIMVNLFFDDSKGSGMTPWTTDSISFYMADSDTDAEEGLPWIALIYDIDGDLLDSQTGTTNDEIQIAFFREQGDIHKLVFSPVTEGPGDSAGIDTLEIGMAMPEPSTLLLLGGAAWLSARRRRA